MDGEVLEREMKKKMKFLKENREIRNACVSVFVLFAALMCVKRAFCFFFFVFLLFFVFDFFFLWKTKSKQTSTKMVVSYLYTSTRRTRRKKKKKNQIFRKVNI